MTGRETEVLEELRARLMTAVATPHGLGKGELRRRHDIILEHVHEIETLQGVESVRELAHVWLPATTAERGDVDTALGERAQFLRQLWQELVDAVPMLDPSWEPPPGTVVRYLDRPHRGPRLVRDE